jgi:CheY-specific phosphatase CheX
MHVRIENGQGLEFDFNFYLKKEDLSDMTVHEFLNPIVSSARKFFEEYIGLSINSEVGYDLFEPEKLLLNKVTALIILRGEKQGLFVLSVDESVMKKMVRNFILDEITEDEVEEYMGDVLAESTNTIVGNSLRMYAGMKDPPNIDIPVSFTSEGVYISYEKAMVSTREMKCDEGGIILSMVVSTEN